MGNGDFMGFGLVLAALWLIDSAIKGRGPLSSLKGILSSKPGTTGASASSYDDTLAPVGTSTNNEQAMTSSGTAGATSNSQAAAAVAYALAQVGKPYVWGGTGPSGYDCSGLCYMAYKAAGVSIGRVTGQQIADGKPASLPLQPGDLVFPDTGHVEMVINATQTVQAPHTGKDIYVGPIPAYIAARRIV